MDLVVNINNTDVVITSSPLMEHSGNEDLFGMMDILFSRDQNGNYKTIFKSYASLVTMELELNQSKTYFDPVFKHHVDDGWYVYVRIPIFKSTVSMDDPIMTYDQDAEKYIYVHKQYETSITLKDFSEIFTNSEISKVLESDNAGTIEFFAYGQLNECVLNMQRKYILSNPCNKTICDDDDKSHRDYLFISVNVVHWLAEKGEYAEAERILEALRGCKGICNNNKNISNYSCNCN